MKDMPAWKAYRLLEAGPIVLVTTAGKERPNPPLIGCIVGPWDYSYRGLRETGECVIAIRTVDLARKVVDNGNCSGEDVDKFEKFKLTPLPARDVDTASTNTASSSCKPSGSGPIPSPTSGARFIITVMGPSPSTAGPST